MQAEEAALLSQLKQSQAGEMDRAQHVSRQHTAWLQLLQLRIKLQPALSAAVRWPAASPGGLWGASDALRDEAAGAAIEVAEMLRDLYSVRQALIGDTAPEVPAGGGSKRTLDAEALEALGTNADEWWAILEAAEASVWPHIEAGVEELTAEVASTAGGSTVQFKAVRQGPLAQCEHLLGQMPRGSETRDHGCHQTVERVLGTPRGPHTPASIAGREQPTTGELYDDTSFYHALLKVRADSCLCSLPQPQHAMPSISRRS